MLLLSLLGSATLAAAAAKGKRRFLRTPMPPRQGRLSGAESLTFGHVIAGACSSGCVLANRLSRDPGVSVCLVEAGGSDDSPRVQTSAGTVTLFRSRTRTYQYRSTSQPQVESGRKQSSDPLSLAMSLARKIILHVPVSDEALLDAFVEQCLHDGVSLVAVVGPGCDRVEDMILEIVVGDGSDDTRYLCTTSHPDEPFEDVLNMVETWDFERGDPVEEIRL